MADETETAPKTKKPSPVGKKASKKSKAKKPQKKNNRSHYGRATAELVGGGKKGGKGVDAFVNARGAVHAKWNGLTISSIFRWMGYNGWDYDRAVRFLKAVKIGQRPETITSQMYAGRASEDGETSNRGYIPKVPKAVREEMNKLAPKSE